ncbi:transcription factor ILI6-like [Primulina eburnea]|uniref:transcription factor ILI6-like n=1 Tax=Primulina eburnea TaxID=1245227 RepID=UPI003C6C9C18
MPNRRFTADEANDLILKLQALLPDSSSRCKTTRVPATKVLKKTCNYIKKLEKEVDCLSEKLSKLMASEDITSIDAITIRTLLLQQ